MSDSLTPRLLITTPPDSSTQQPLTSPSSEKKARTSVERILQEIENRKSGRSLCTNPWWRFRLSAAQYKDLEAKFQTDGFVQDKLRFSYFPSSEIFVLRMPSLLHDSFTARIVDNIARQLDLIAGGQGPASDFARHIKRFSSSTVIFDDPAFGRHDPDDQFRYDGALYPNVIIETSYSQKRKDLGRLADEYILGSRGNIRVVVGVDIEYKHKSATISMWRPRRQVNELGRRQLRAHQVLFNQEIGSANSAPNQRADFRLQLEDFVPLSLLPTDTKLGKDIFISSADLDAHLLHAKATQLTDKQRIGIAEIPDPDEELLYRSSSPVEQLNAVDESRFEEEEARAEKRSDQDPDYTDS